MRVLYWTDFFLPDIGGIETFSANLIPALQARGHDVTVLTSDHQQSLPPVEQMGSIPVHRLPIWEALRTNDLKALFRVRKAVAEFKRELNPDIVHLHFGASAFYHLQTQTAGGPPTLTTVHALPESSLADNSLFGKAAHASRAVNAVSKKGLQLLAGAFPELADRFSFVYYGLGPSLHDAIEVTPPSFDEPLLLCLGRLTPQKGFDVALRAFARVERDQPKARLVIVGEGVEEFALKELAVSLGIAHKVDFTGAVPPQQVFEVINKATLMLLPSRFEGLPLVALEAARMHRPIVATAVDGLPDLITDQESGLLLQDSGEQALAEAILTLLREPQKALQMGRAAARRVQENFSFDECVSKYDRLYHQVAQC